MTREEAIADIKNNIKPVVGGKSLDMAIEALSKPNYETDTEVRLAVMNRKKEKVILWDAFEELEYYPIEALKGGDAEVNETKSPYMQHSRHDDGRMAMEQAVKWVKFVHDVLYEDKDEEIREALNMAIEALSADVVSREAYDAMVKHAKALENLSIEDRVRIMYDAVEDIHNIRIINEVVRCKDCKYGEKENE